MEGKKTFPDVYVMSKFTTLATELKKHLPESVNVTAFHLAGFGLQKYDIIEVPEEVIQILRNVEVVVTDTTCLAYLLYRLPNVKWVQSTRAGIEQVIQELDESKPLPRYKLTRYVDSWLGDSMANYVMAQILNAERNFFLCHDLQKLGKWERSNLVNFRLLKDLTVGILGAGTAGTAVGKLLKKGGCRIIAFVRKSRTGSSESYDEAVTDLNVILNESDYICSVLPSTEKTRGLLDNDVLKNCKKKPVFINIGRGDIIRNSSIIKALRNGWISQAILDVFEEEPLLPDSPLWNMPEVHITPHVGATPKPEHLAKFVAANYQRYVNGETLMNVVDWENGY